MLMEAHLREMLGEERAGGETPHYARHRLLVQEEATDESEWRLLAARRGCDGQQAAAGSFQRLAGGGRADMYRHGRTTDSRH